jgi:hypothetical protein
MAFLVSTANELDLNKMTPTEHHAGFTMLTTLRLRSADVGVKLNYNKLEGVLSREGG